MTLQKILLPTDFSEASKKAIHYALTLFKGKPCEFTILYTFTANTEPDIAIYLIEEIRKNAEKQMKKFVAELVHFDSDAQNHVFQPEIIPLPLSGAIDLLSEKNEFALIVVGASGQGQNVRLGSSATDIIRNIAIETLVIPYHVSFNPLKNIVIALDSHDISDEKIFDKLISFLDQANVRITLLSILQERQQESITPKAIEKSLEGFKINKSIIKNNDIEKGIKDYIELHRVDLLVMISRHHSLLDVIFNNSMTRKLAYHPLIPLLSIPDESSEETFADGPIPIF